MRREKGKSPKGITLIALVITVIILLILASIAMASLLGENGIITKAVRAREEHTLNQYKEEIGLIVAEEITERQTEEKLEPIIKSLEDKIKQKNWVKEKGTSKYNKDMIPILDEQAQEGKYLIIESKEGYEFILEVDNEKETAKLITANREAGKKYKITYDLNGGEGEAPTIQEVKQGFSILLPENTATKEDYIFVGWSTDKSGNSTPILVGGAYSPQGEEDEITLYAIWSYNAITITFDGNGATGGSMTNKKATKGEDSTLTKNQFIKDGYWFVGWTKTKGSINKEYDDGGTINTEEDITLYAIWEKYLVVSYNGSGATNTTMQSQLVKKGESVTLRSNTFTKEGCNFVGWTLTAGGTTKNYDNGAKILNVTSDLTLYAIWNFASPTVTDFSSNIHSGTSLDTKYSGITWATLGKIANAISNSSVSWNTTEEVTTIVEGKSYTVGVGDTKAISYNGRTYTARILGFNHDLLTNKSAYGGSNTYAGISFDFVEVIMQKWPGTEPSGYHKDWSWIDSYVYEPLGASGSRWGVCRFIGKEPGTKH